MTDQPVPQEETPPPRKRGGWPKGRKRAKRRAQADPPRPHPVAAPSEFAGLTEKACCDACNIDRCVITGKAICGSPFCGFVPHGWPLEVIERFGRAKKAVAHRKIDLTGF